MTDDQPDRDAVGADGVTEVRDITLGSAKPADYSAADITPIEDLSQSELLDLLQADEPPTRRRAILALAQQDGDPSVTEKIAEGALTDPDSQVRQFGVEALGKLDGNPAVAEEILATDTDPWVRAEAAVTLDRLAREDYEATFEELLDDEAMGVRRNALISLTRIREDSARGILLEALDDPSGRVREWAVKLLGQFEDKEVESRLTEILEDDSEVEIVRETAARSLGARGTDVAELLEGETGTASADEHMLNQVPDK